MPQMFVPGVGKQNLSTPRGPNSDLYSEALEECHSVRRLQAARQNIADRRIVGKKVFLSLRGDSGIQDRGRNVYS